MPTGDPPLTLADLREIPLERLKGVGAALGARLADMELHSVLDLLQHYPRRWVDRTKKTDIAALAVGEEATVFAEVRTIHGRRTRQGRALVEAVVHDGTSMLTITFFNQAWREKQLSVGTEASFFGKLDVYRGKRQMTNPVVDVVGRAGVADEKTGVIVPVYPQSGKAEVFTWQLRGMVSDALAKCRVRGFADPLDETVLDRCDLLDRGTALRAIHRPESMSELGAAKRRLIFDELLRMQVGLVARKRAFEAEESGIRHRVDGPLVDAFVAGLPFELTGDQRRALDEITHDLAGPAPMHRLLQGDVGSGKTVVALAALLVAVQGGYQGAFMAPTEVLAEQHYLGSLRLLEGLSVPAEGSLLADRPVRVALLTNRTTAAERRRITAGLESGEIDILLGTHALLYGDASFSRLGLAVVDEQHRFGVEQRALLRGKGDQPDVLVMTATPIPRTAAMLVYGDLDKSELRELPPGRTPIETTLVEPSPLAQAAAWAALRAQVAAGHQAYVVCPLVEDKGKVEAKAATAEYERLQAEELHDMRVALLHGQMPSKEKEAVMRAYRAGELDVLVATTVIEVGVDVANATVMIVEDADRFGLSQLHQLRGRVGRGGDRSYCFLFADPSTVDGEQRLTAMAESTDGFALAEKDLEIRGSGEVFGERQAGFSDLKLGRIPRDEAIVIQARGVAEEILDRDPELGAHAQLRDEVHELLGDAVDFLFKS
ncbi:MAG: ATP-dependent helicase RecG [Actinomycetota bacterium]|nr:ATP-dependent helicase RecG [Actinomycetota bacterium]